MAVTHEAATWAYRLILGREPESETVIHQAMEESSMDTLRARFLNSLEFRSSALGQRPGLDVGRHQDVTEISVQTSCTEAEMSRMLSNIAREWRTFGETAPHWSVVTSDAFSVENIDRNLEHFYALGQEHLKSMLNPLTRAGLGERRFHKALDFGCGVGRLTLPLATVTDKVTGVDISPPHLRLARQRAEQIGADNVEFLAIDVINDLDQLDGYDLIVSFIVLQHNPPPVMVEILRKLLGALGPSGCAIIQIPTYIAGFRFDVADYLSNAQPPMEMNAIPQHVVFDTAESAGCRVLEVREDSFMGADLGVSHTFAFQKRE